MTRHMVEAFELEDFSFEEEICAQYGEWNGQGSKSLKVYVVPYLDYMHYKLYVNKELVAIYPAFEAALIGYNDVCAEMGRLNSSPASTNQCGDCGFPFTTGSHCTSHSQHSASGGVLPEQDGSDAQISFWAGFEFAVCGLHNSNIRAAWNDFKGSEQFKRLNSYPASAGAVDERAAFEAWIVSVEGLRFKSRFDRVTAGPFSDDYRDGQVQGAWNVWQARGPIST